jgi:serine/threonine-protein kinase
MGQSGGQLPTLAGRYVLESRLGQGDTSQIYRATDTVLGRTVAVKVLRLDLLGDADARARLEREASSATLDHPDVLQVYDRGVDAHPSEPGRQAPFVVTEYVDGGPLAAQLGRGPISPEDAGPMMLGVLSALETAHRHGLIHGGPSPATVLISSTGHVKLANFLGGPGATPRGDLHAAARLFREMLTGSTRPEADYPSEVPADLRAVVDRGLSPEPGRRWVTAAEMRAALEDALPESARAVPAAALGTDAVIHASAPSPDAAVRRRGAAPATRRTILAVVGVATAAVLGVGGYALTQVLPGASSGSPRSLTVPKISGMTPEQARETLQSAGIKFTESTAASADVPKGQAAATSPGAGSTIDPQDSVILYVSSGPGHAVLPASLVGATEAQARAELERLGMTVGSVLEQDSSDKPSGQVLAVSPAVGSDVAAGTSVVLTISTGKVTVPNVVGLSEADAIAALRDRGLRCTVTHGVSATMTAGRVYEQSPGARDSVDQRTEVTLRVSTTPRRPTSAPTPRPRTSSGAGTAGSTQSPTSAPASTSAPTSMPSASKG